MEFLTKEKFSNIHFVWIDVRKDVTSKLKCATVLYKGELCLIHYLAGNPLGLNENTEVPIFRLTKAEKIYWIEKQQTYERESGFDNTANQGNTDFGFANGFSYLHFNTPSTQIEEMFNTVDIQ